MTTGIARGVFVATAFALLPVSWTTADATRPLHPCDRIGFRAVYDSEYYLSEILPALRSYLEVDDWVCEIEGSSVSCKRPRIADEAKGIYRDDKWISRYICIVNKAAGEYWVRYTEFDGAIAYQNEFEERFGYPRDPEREGSFYFSVK